MKNCIFCGHAFSNERRCSREHIIPECLGGFWFMWFACRECNSKGGHTTDSEWLRNHEVIRALTELHLPVDSNVFRGKREAPKRPNTRPKYELVGYAETKSPFFVERQRRTVFMDRDFEEDHKKGIGALTGIMQSDFGISRQAASQFASDAITRLIKLEAGESLHLERIFSTRKIIISSTPTEVTGTVNMLDHFEPRISVRSVLKIAYGFAAALLQEDILCAEYDRFRRFLMEPSSGEKIRALALETVWEDLQPIHILAARARHGKLLVIVLLFNSLGFIVELGPDKEVTDAQCQFDITHERGALFHFGPESDAVLNEILETEFQAGA